MSDELKLWRTLIAPEAHAANVKCPVLLLSATNDFHGRMDLAYRTLDRVPAKVKGQVFTANYDHHVEPAEARSLPLFMDAHLKGEGGPWPATPRVEIASGGDVPVVRVAPADAERVEQVDVYYCLNNDVPTARFWRAAAGVRREKDGFAATGPVPRPDGRAVRVRQCHVSVRRAGQLAAGDEAGRPNSPARGRPWSGRRSWTRWTRPATGPGFRPTPTRAGRTASSPTGPGRPASAGSRSTRRRSTRAGPMAFYFGTRKVGDPQYRGTGRKALLLDHLAAHAPDKVTVRLSHRLPGQNPTEFTAVLPAATGEGAWRTWRMEPGQFRDAGGRPLPDWDHVERFVLDGTSPPNRPPVFKRLRWAD